MLHHWFGQMVEALGYKPETVSSKPTLGMRASWVTSGQPLSFSPADITGLFIVKKNRRMKKYSPP